MGKKVTKADGSVVYVADDGREFARPGNLWNYENKEATNRRQRERRLEKKIGKAAAVKRFEERRLEYGLGRVAELEKEFKEYKELVYATFYKLLGMFDEVMVLSESNSLSFERRKQLKIASSECELALFPEMEGLVLTPEAQAAMEMMKAMKAP